MQHHKLGAQLSLETASTQKTKTSQPFYHFVTCWTDHVEHEMATAVTLLRLARINLRAK